MKIRNTSSKIKGESGLTLSPLRQIIEITGPMTYNESAQAWNIIRLRKDILHEFPELKDKRTMFTYKLVIPRSPEAIKQIIEQCLQSQNIVPIFLSFAKIDNKTNVYKENN